MTSDVMYNFLGFYSFFTGTCFCIFARMCFREDVLLKSKGKARYATLPPPRRNNHPSTTSLNLIDQKRVWKGTQESTHCNCWQML